MLNHIVCIICYSLESSSTERQELAARCVCLQARQCRAKQHKAINADAMHNDTQTLDTNASHTKQHNVVLKVVRHNAQHFKAIQRGASAASQSSARPQLDDADITHRSAAQHSCLRRTGRQAFLLSIDFVPTSSIAHPQYHPSSHSTPHPRCHSRHDMVIVP